MKTNFLKSSIALVLLAIIAVSCKKNIETTAPDDTSLKVEKTALHEDFSCMMRIPESSEPATEGNGYARTQWANGSVIKVRFVGGSSYVRNKVTQYAKSWEAYANVTFQFVADNASADVKVSFDPTGRSWSYIGTDAKRQSVSMNYGWFTDSTSDTEFRRTTVHEFGHALGMEHEQSHPDSNIPWNKQVVYNDLAGAPNFWDKATVDHNVFAVNSRTGLNYTPYDRSSIMHYPIKASWTTNNVTIAPNNSTISQGDIAFVKKYYPGRG